MFQEHFFNPRNVGDVGDGGYTGTAGSTTCGAVIRISLAVDQSQRINRIKFKAAGCSVLVAAASLLTETVKGKTTAEAAMMAPSLVREIANGLQTSNRLDCVELAKKALISAITSYSDSARAEWEGDEALICTCFCVSERVIEAKIQQLGLSTIDEVTRECSAGAGCRSCHPLIQDILDDCQRTAELVSHLS